MNLTSFLLVVVCGKPYLQVVNLIDKTLSWKFHIDTAATKITQKRCRPNCKITPQRVLSNIYQALIQPHLTYVHAFLGPVVEG